MPSGDRASTQELPPQPLDRRWRISVDNKTYGPYTGSELADMARAGQFQPTDFSYAEGATAWLVAQDDPILRSLFTRDDLCVQSIDRAGKKVRRLRFRSGQIFSIGLSLAALAWFVWPYYALYCLIDASRTGDVVALENEVDWNGVRQGIKSDVNSTFLHKLAQDLSKGSSPVTSIGNGLAMMLGPTILNQLIDNTVTPASLSEGVRAHNSDSVAKKVALRGKDAAAKELGELSFRRVRYAFFYGNPFTFVVEIIPTTASTLKEPVRALLRWSGNWKLTRVYIPADIFADDIVDLLKWTSAVFRDDKTIPPKAPQPSEQSYLKESEISAVRRKIAGCWKPPAGVETVTPVRVRILLGRNGWLLSGGVVVNMMSDPIFIESAKSALAAIRNCQPFALPATKYDAWKDMEITFDPTLNGLTANKKSGDQ